MVKSRNNFSTSAADGCPPPYTHTLQGGPHHPDQRRPLRQAHQHPGHLHQVRSVGWMLCCDRDARAAPAARARVCAPAGPSAHPGGRVHQVTCCAGATAAAAAAAAGASLPQQQQGRALAGMQLNCSLVCRALWHMLTAADGALPACRCPDCGRCGAATTRHGAAAAVLLLRKLRAVLPR